MKIKMKTPLEKKNKEVMDLVSTIKLYNAYLISKNKKSRIDDLYSRLQFRLGELLEEAQLREADIKINVYQGILDILKEKDVLE